MDNSCNKNEYKIIIVNWFYICTLFGLREVGVLHWRLRHFSVGVGRTGTPKSLYKQWLFSYKLLSFQKPPFNFLVNFFSLISFKNQTFPPLNTYWNTKRTDFQRPNTKYQNKYSRYLISVNPPVLLFCA